MIHVTSCAQQDLSPETKSFPSHPRLLMLEGEEVAIKTIIGTDPSWKAVHNIIVNGSSSIIGLPPVERVLIGRRLLDKSREALRRIFYLSYAWRMTGEKKYLDRAEKEMLAVCAFTDWNPSHFLDVAEMTMAVSIGYDWLYSALPESSRKSIRQAIIDKGLKPSFDSKYNSWLKGTNNWNQVCNAGMTYGALAIYEDDSTLAKSVISRASESIRLPMGDYQPDGAYPEGYGYWGYGTSFNVMFISAYEKVYNKKFDVPENAGLLKSSGYLENMIGPTRSNFNYSDGGSGAGLNPAMFWIANRNADLTGLWMEKSFVKELKSSSDRLLPAIMIWNAGMSLDKISPPVKTIWVGQGKNPVALMRTSWEDPNTIFVGFKGGSPKVNHGHMDAGTFVMDALGVRWAMDFGMQDYNSLETAGVDLWNSAQNSERWQVFRYNNFVHNTLTINGQLQQVSGSAPIISSSENINMMNAISDLTTIYNGQLKSANRGVAIVDKNYVTVRDEIETLANETVVRWTLLTSATVAITGPNTAELTKSGKKLTIKVSEPGTITMKTWSTVPTHSYDAANPGTYLIGFEAIVPANTKANLQVFLIPEGAVQNPATIPGILSNWNK
jgi:hypothetical protein